METKEQRKLFEMMLSADRGGASLLVDEWAREHGSERLVVELLAPALELLGNREGTNLAEGYVAAKIAEDVLGRTAGTRWEARAAEAARGPVVLGNIEDDHHALGRRMVATFLRVSGWTVHDLGNDVVPAAFVDAALAAEARVIAASAMMHTTAVNIGKLREEIDARGLTGDVQLAVGGAVFNLRAGLVDEVGGDGTARNAWEASDLMTRLRDAAEAGENDDG